jgi:hypothetical protein
MRHPLSLLVPVGSRSWCHVRRSSAVTPRSMNAKAGCSEAPPRKTGSAPTDSLKAPLAAERIFQLFQRQTTTGRGE